MEIDYGNVREYSRVNITKNINIYKNGSAILRDLKREWDKSGTHFVCMPHLRLLCARKSRWIDRLEVLCAGDQSLQSLKYNFRTGNNTTHDPSAIAVRERADLSRVNHPEEAAFSWIGPRTPGRSHRLNMCLMFPCLLLAQTSVADNTMPGTSPCELRVPKSASIYTRGRYNNRSYALRRGINGDGMRKRG